MNFVFENSKVTSNTCFDKSWINLSINLQLLDERRLFRSSFKEGIFFVFATVIPLVKSITSCVHQYKRKQFICLHISFVSARQTNKLMSLHATLNLYYYIWIECQSKKKTNIADSLSYSTTFGTLHSPAQQTIEKKKIIKWK